MLAQEGGKVKDKNQFIMNGRAPLTNSKAPEWCVIFYIRRANNANDQRGGRKSLSAD